MRGSEIDINLRRTVSVARETSSLKWRGDISDRIETISASPTSEREHLPELRESSKADYRRMLKNHIRPHFGTHTKVADVTTDDVKSLHRKLTAAGNLYRANRVIAVLSKMMSLARKWNIADKNPCQGVKKNYEAKRKRYLSGHELARLIQALNAHPDQEIATIFRLLMLTGARRGEVLAMKWAGVNLTDGVWTKAASTTKQNAEHIVPLSAAVRALLSEIRAEQSSGKKQLPVFVFPGAGSTGHVVAIKKAWRQLCKAADISNLRIHDLRHSFASSLHSGGASLGLIGALLGHSNPATTARYAHLYDEAQRAAVETVGAIIGAAGKEPEEPVPFKREH